MMWWSKRDKVLEQVEDDLMQLQEKRFSRKGLYAEVNESSAIHRDINELKRVVRTIQRNGVSMWNYKQVLPQIFEVISGAFDVVEDLADKVQANHKVLSQKDFEIGRSIEFLTKKIDALVLQNGVNEAYDRMDDNKLTKVASKK